MQEISARVHTLDNGLTVLLLENHTAPVATFWVWYRVGSRNELPGATGISHWVEHMLFKGTPTHPKGMLTRYIDRLGGRWNAFTWKDYTAYHEILPAEHLPVAITLEADRMTNTIFHPGEVESERTVILSEREGYENFPPFLLGEEVDAAAHKVHPYRHPVIGWKDDLRVITPDDLHRHYRTYYHPNNAVAVAVGAFDADAILDRISRAFGEIPPGPPPSPVRVREPAQEGERRVVLQRPGGATAYLHLAYHVPQAAHHDLAVLLVVDGLLSGFKSLVPFENPGGGRSSRLYRALVDAGVASSVSSSLIPGIDPTLFRITATAKTGVEVSHLEERVLSALDRLATEPVPDEELAKVKKQAKAHFVYTRDGVYRIAMGLGAFAVVDGPEAFDTLLHRIEQVTSEDVMRVAVTFFNAKNHTTGWYLPDAGASASTTVAAHHPSVFWYSQPAEGSGTPSVRAQPWAIPITPETVHRAELRNGLIALVKEQPGSGLVAVHGYVRAGTMFDGARSGLARCVAAMLQRGTQARSSQELAETLDAMGATLFIGADTEIISVGLRSLAEDAVAVLRLLREVLMHPTFPLEEVEKVRGELLTALRVAMQDTRHVADRTFRSLLFPPTHPYRHPPDGDEAVLTALQRDDLVAFHQTHVRPEATILAVVGDVAAPRVLDAVEDIFGAWSGHEAWSLPAVPPVAPLSSPLRAERRLSGKIQSDIVLGVPGLARTDPAYYPAMMANLILGQIGMMGRLGDRVRERQGLAYYAFSDLRAGLLAGPWTVRAGVNPANEAAAIASVLAEIRQLQERGPQDDELADARDFLIGYLAVRLETNTALAQMLADIELFGLGLDYLVRYPQIVRGIPRDAVIEAARRFDIQAYAVAIAGPQGTESTGSRDKGIL